MAQDIQIPPADAAKENKTKRKVTYTPVRTVSGSELREMAGDGSGVLENEWNDPSVRTFTEDGFKGVYPVQPPEKYHTDEELEEAMPTGNAAGIGAGMVFSGGAIPPSVAKELYKNETSRAGNTSERYARMKEERAWRDNEAKYAVDSAIADGFKPDGTSMRNIQEKYVASYYYTAKGRDRYNKIKEETNRLKEYLTPYIEQETAGNPLYQKAVADYRAGKISMEQLAETQEMLRRESPSYKKAAEWSMEQNRQYAREASDYFSPYIEKEMVPFMEQGLDKSISDFRSLQEERPDEFTGVADNLLNKAEKLRDAARNGGFLTGMGDTASDWNFWSLGIADLYRAKNIREIADKADKALREGADVEFTPEELNTLQAYAIYQQALNLYSEKAPLSYTMGQVTAEMIPFAASIALGQGLARLTTKGISAVAKKAATQEVAQAVSQALGKSKLLNSRFAQGFRQGAGFGGETTGAAGVAGNMLGGMTRGTGEALTVGAPRTWAEKNERMTGQADIDVTDSGQPLITGFSGRESSGEAFAHALAGNAIEYQSERAGQLMDRLGGALKARLPKDLQLSMGSLGDYIKSITPKSLKRFYKSPYYKAFRDNIQLQGVWSEYGEEELANWERVLLGLDEPDVLLDNEQRVETFLSLLPAQLMMGAGAGVYSAGRYRQASARLDKLMKEMKASDPELYEKYGKVRGEMDGFDVKAVTGLLSSIDRDGKLNADQKTEAKRAALAEYYTKMLKSAQEAEIFGRADEEMRQAYEQAEALKERGSGNIVTADYEGRKVNITDDTGSDTVVIEYVEEDGKRVKRQVPRSAVGNAATVPVADVVNSKADEITARVKAEMQDLEHPGVAAPEPGTRLVHNGENYAVTSISPDGVVIMREDEEGNYSLPEVISTDTYYAEKQAEIDAQEQEQQPQSGERGEAAQEIASPAEEEPAPVTGGGAVQEETAPGRMPKDEQGQPIYEQADPDTAWDALLEQAGGDEAMAQEVANDIVSEQEKALKTAERELKKVQDGKPQQRKGDAPLTVEARIAAKQAVREQTSRAQAGVDEARKRLEAWRKIAETPQRRRRAIEAERRQEDEQGQPIYEQADPDTAWDALLEQAGGDEAMAQEVANDIVSEQEKALKTAERELKKVQDGKPQQRKGDAPLTVEARIAAKQAVREQTSRAQAGVDEARKRLEAWRKIAETPQRRRRAIEAERRQEEEEAARLRGIQEEQERAEREEAERIRREALNGVPDFIEDRPQDARARGYRRVNGNRVDRQQPIQARRGGEVQVKFDDNNIPTGHAALIEASQLQPSHTDGRRNPRHFIDEAQPKERNDEASVMSSRKIAANIRPEEITSSVTAYTGAPTVNSRGEVIQGNNRSAALLEMWAEHPEQAAKYRQYLADHAADFGLLPEDVEAMQQPVLVNMLDVTDDEAITLGQFVAQDTESGGTERIKPKNMVRKMGDDMRGFANRLLASADEEMSFAELVDRNGVDVLKWMQQKGYITPTQYKSAFDSKGNLTAEAKNDLKGVMYQSIFQNGSSHLEEMFNALPAKAQKAILATAYRDYDSPNTERMIEEIQNSISAYHALSQDPAFAGAGNYKEARIAAEAWKRQYAFDDATGESYLPSERYSNFALLLATMYKGQTQKFIQNTLGHIYDLVQGTQEADLFNQPDNTPRTLVQAINETLGNLREELLLNENFTYNGQRRSNVLAGGSASGQRGRQGSDGNAPSGGRAENGTRTDDGSGRTGISDNERGRQGNFTDIAGRQQDSLEASEGEVRLSDEIDENGRQFVLTSNGQLSFGEITEESGLTPAPILLSEGIITNPATNDGYGLVHIEARHGDQIRKAGYKSVIEFIEDVAQNYERVKEGNIRNGNPTYLIQLKDKHNNTLIVELSSDGNYWNINTAGIFKESYGKNRREIYNRHTTVQQSAETVGASQEAEQSGTTTSSSMNAPTSNIVSETPVKTEPQQPNNAVSTGSSLSENEEGGITSSEPNGKPTVSGSKDKKTSAETSQERQKTDSNLSEAFKQQMNIRIGQLSKFIKTKDGKLKKKYESLRKTPFFAIFDSGNIYEGPVAIAKTPREALNVAFNYDIGDFEVLYVDFRTKSLDMDLLSIYDVSGFRGDVYDENGAYKDEAKNLLVERISRLGKGNSTDVQGVEDFQQRESGADALQGNADENIRRAESEVERNPTEAQKEAGNYRKGHVRVDGLDVTIENPKGSVRSGTDADGKRWENVMNNTYGYMRGTEGVDGDHIDVFLSDNPESGNVYVVDQRDPKTGEFDEHKVMYGFGSMEEARDAYLKNYTPGWQGLGTITEVSKDEFRKWIGSSKRKTKPFAEYRSVKKEAGQNEDVRQSRDVSNPLSEEEAAIRDVIVERLRESGIEVITDAEAGQRVLDEANGKDVRLNEKQKKANNTGLPEQDALSKAAVISFADSANILNNLEKIAKTYQDSDRTHANTILSELGRAIKAEHKGSGSQYATIEAKNGDIVTIRLSDHNVSVEKMDNAGRGNAISIVISRKANDGIKGGGNAHIVEYFYPDKSLRNAGGKAIADIARSLQQTFYSGEYTDTTGLAEVQEVNADVIREHRVYHGSGADFEAFDHSHMGEGEGAQAYGWGSYVTDVEGIGRAYAKASTGNKRENATVYKRRQIRDNEISINVIRGMIAEYPEQHREREKRLSDLEKELADQNSQKGRIEKESGKDSVAYRNFMFYAEDIIKDLERNIERTKRSIEDEAGYNEQRKRQVEELVAENARLQSEIDAIEAQYPRHLYTVEIPDDTGKNYLEWEKPVTKEQQGKIYKQLRDEKMTIKGASQSFWNGKSSEWQSGQKLIDFLIENLGSDKAASEFLSRAGFTGISYPAQATTGGRKDGARNYVIFDEKDLQITDHVRFFRTPGGEAYGFTVGGRIYIDPRTATADTPIHEYAHLWAGALRQANPKEWNNIVELMRDTPAWDEVKRLYPELESDEEIADEALAMYSGRRGAERLREAARRAWDGSADLGAKAAAARAMGRVRDALKRFWKGVADFLHIHYTSAEEVADKVMSDLLEGVNPNSRAELSAEERAIEEQAKKDGTWMKAPNGKPTNLTEKQWVQVRTRAFKDWFGDWEKAAKLRMIGNISPVSVDRFSHIEQKEAEAIFEKLENGKNIHDGCEVQWVKSAVGKILRHKGFDTSRLIPVIKDVFDNSVLIASEQEMKREGHKEHPNFKGYHHYVGKIQADGKEYYVRFTLQELNTHNKNIVANQLHSTYVSDIEITSADTRVNTGNAPATANTSTFVDAKLRQFLEEAKEAADNSSKVVDENGEPLVVYHGSDYRPLNGNGILIPNNGAMGKAVYFSSAFPEAADYAREKLGDMSLSEDEVYDNGYITEVFVNVRDEEDIAPSSYGNGEIIVAVRESNQIKSATDNAGAFSAGNDDIRYSRAEEDDANRRFNEELSGLTEENADKVVLSLGRPSAILRAAGVEDKPMKLYGNKVIKKMKKHGFRLDELQNLPEAVAEPIAVFNNYQKDSNRSILTELRISNGNFLVTVDLGKDADVDFNIVTSVFGKGDNNIIGWINKGYATYIDKEKAQEFLSHQSAPIAATAANSELDTATNIVKDFENPSLEDENLFRIGETKRIGRQGKKITFTRANPTVTLNALKKRLENEGVEYKVHKARTGSGYISFEREGIYYDLRSANHTRAYTSYNASDDTGGVELSFTREDGRIDGIDIDLSENEMGVNEIYSLMDEAARFNANDTGMFAVTERLVYPEEINGYEHIAAALGKKADDLIREREMALRAEYARYKDTALQGYERPNLLPFKAGNGAVVEDESVRKVYFNGKPAFKRYATEALSEYFRERNKAMRDFEAAHAMSYDEWLASAHPEIRQEEDNMRDGTGAVTDVEVSMENDPMSKLAGKSIRTRKQRQAFAERERRRMAGAVRRMAERLHLDNVEVVTDASTLTGRRARAKGFYSPRTGKIVIVIPNHASEADAMQTLLHEAVAHYGLRQLFGEHFDTFLWNVYRNADRDVRERINALASEKGWDFPTATEEYLASLAENTDFENAQRSGWWEKIKRLFIDMLHKIGLDGFGGVTLSDNELRYILWRSYENLREPGAERSITGVAADVVKQAELKVGNYAEETTGGDMAAERKSAMTEKQRRIEKLRRSEPVVATGEEYKGKYELNNKSAADYIIKSIKGEYVNKDTGVPIKITRKGAFKITRHDAENEAHLKSIALIPRLIENAVFVEEEPNSKANNGFDSYRYYVAGLNMAGSDYTVKMAVGVKNGETYYDHSLTEIEKSNLINRIDEISSSFTDNKIAISDLKDKRLVSILQTDEEENEDELMYRDGGAEEDGQRKRGFMADMRLAWENLGRLMNPTKGNDLITEASRQAAAIKPDDAQRKKKLRRLNAAVNLAIASTKMHESYVDKAVSLRPLLAAVEGWTGKPLADEFNIYLHYDKYTSLHQAGVKEFYENEYADFMEAVSAVMETKGCKVEDVWNYMFLKHGLERNSVMAKRDADREFRKGETEKSPQELYEDNRKKEYSGVRAVLESMGMNTEGMTLQEVEKEAEKHVKDFEVSVTGNTIDNLWDKTRTATSFAIEREYRAGILSRQQRDDILNMYQYYIPLRGWADPKAEELFSYDSSLDSGYSVPEKQSKGRKSVADSPAAYIAAAAQTAIIRSVRNEMKKQIYYLAELTKGSGLMSVGNVWEVQDATGDWSIQTAQITDDMTAEQADAETARFEKEMGVLARQGKARLQGEDMEIAGGRKLSKEQLREHQVYVKINGRTKIVTVNTDNSVAKAINNSFSNIDNNRMMTGWMTFQRFMAGMMTQFNPEFIISNLLRDMTSAMTYGGPVNIGREVPAAVEDAVNYFIRKKKLTETDALFQEFIRGGGETGYVHLLELSKIDKDFRNEIRRLKGGAAYNILHKNVFAKYLDYVSRANKAVEVLTRYAAYRAARKEGKSISRAIDDAKNITANFNRKGSQTMVTGYGAPLAVLTALSPILPRMYAFFNASIQGAYAFFRAAARNPLRVWPIVALSFAEGILQAFLGDGDDDEDKYQYINDYLKRSTISFVAGDKHSVSIPMAYELSAWHAIGHLLYETVNGDMDVPTFALESLSTICSSFTPVAFDGIQRYYEDNEYHYMLSPFLPTNLTPIGELLENRDWLGSPIARKNMWNASQPEYRRVYERTGQFYVEASKWLNYVSGGNDVEKGAVNINPAQVEHLIEGYFSGTGRFYSRTAGVLYDLLTEGELRDASEMPVISRFVKPLNFNSIVNKQRSRLYDDMHAGADKAEWLDSYMKGESGEDAMTVSKRIGELLQDAEYLKYKRAKKVLEATKELEVLHETAENAGDKDVAEKIEERIKRMYDDYEEYADQIDGKSD